MSYYQRPQYQYRARPAVFAAPAPRRMAARFDGVCARCHGPIVAGTDILYTRGQPAVHAECPPRVEVEVEDLGNRAERELVERELAEDALAALRGKLEVEDAGVYRLVDGTIVKVQANREKTRVYAKRLVEIGGERLTEAGDHVHAEYRYEAGLIEQVSREGVKLTLEEAKALTIRYGFCIRCGRHLKAAQSVEQGMGPVCITYFEGA